MKRIIQRINWMEYGIAFLILFLTWGGMLRRSFNADTLIHMVSKDFDVRVWMEDGRYLCGLFDFLLGRIGIRTTTHTGVTALLALLVMAGTIVIIKQLFQSFVLVKTLSDKVAYTAVTGLIFTNVLAAELLMFGECAAYFALAYFCAALGSLFFGQKKFVWAAFCMAVSSCFYQNGVVFGAIVISAFIFCDHRGKLTLKTVKDEIVCLGVTFGMGLLNFLSVNILTRMGIIIEFRKRAGVNDFWKKCYLMVQSFVGLLFDSRELLIGAWIPLLFLLICSGAYIIYRLRQRDWNSIIYFVLLFFGLCLMQYVIPILTAYFGIAPRLLFVFYLIQALVAVIALTVAEERCRRLLCIIGSLYLLIQMFFSQIIVTEHFVSNTLDESYAGAVYEKIQEYESETGITVRKLAVEKDLDAPFFYRQVSWQTDQINERAFGVADAALMWWVSGRLFERVEMNQDIFDTYFKGKNWNYFDTSTQLKIQGDTAYLMVF